MLRLEALPRMVKGSLDTNSFSPDILELTSRWALCPVLVWGTEKNRYFEHGILHGYLPIGYGWTQSAYVLRIHKTQQFPAVFYEPVNPAAAKVYGEIYMLPVHKIAELDNFHMNTMFMQRRWRQAYVHDALDQPDKKVLKDVLMYTMIPAKGIYEQYTEGTVIQAQEPYYLWRITDDAKCEQAYKTMGKERALPF